MYNYWGGENILSPPPLFILGGRRPSSPPRFLRLWMLHQELTNYSVPLIKLSENIPSGQSDLYLFHCFVPDIT